MSKPPLFDTIQGQGETPVTNLSKEAFICDRTREETTASEAPHGRSSGQKSEDGAQCQNQATDPGGCDFGECVSPGTAHGTGSTESNSGEAIGYREYE